MKKGTKIGLGVALLVLGTVAVTSCTQSFCSATDTARIMYAYEPGITRYSAGGSDTLSVTDAETGYKYTIENLNVEVATFDTGTDSFKFGADDNGYASNLNSIIAAAKNSGYIIPTAATTDYFRVFDQLVLEGILKEALAKNGGNITVNCNIDDEFASFKDDIAKYSYKKFVKADGAPLWEVFDEYDAKVRATPSINIDAAPSTDFLAVYKQRINTYANTYRTCLTTVEGKYGSYGSTSDGVYIGAKDWGYAWSKGFFEGLLVFPIGWLIDQIVGGFRGTGLSAGGSALLGIIFVTMIIRSLMLLATFKSTAGNAKMTELQPEIQKIQNKYPNSNTSQAEKQRMAEEMQRLYKKHKINPFSSLLVMIVQFPVFICVWGALSGSSAITNGSIFGLSLALGIKDVLFNATNWTVAGGYSAVTALIVFILMAGAQTVSMLLPQWIQKAKAKKVSKLGKNPAQQQQNTTMKIFTYVMLAMIIFMGFSLVSAMGIYWFIGALFSIAQTLITQYITAKKAKNK